jgi:hypothetical protein
MTRSAYKNNFTDLGLVTNLSIDQDAAGPGTWILTLDDERAARQVYRLTDGGARGLWYGLTRIIHPLATGQLSSTWSEAPGTTASLFTILAARVRPCRRDGLIEMDAVSAVNGFTARFTAREGRRLWAALERIYGTTGSHSPDQPGSRSH